MAAGSTYEKIATTTLGSAASEVTFTSISGSYTDIVIIVTAAQTGGGTGNLSLQFNSDTGTNYSSTNLSGGFGSASSDRRTSTSNMSLTNLAYLEATIGTYIVNIQNYSNSTTYKTVLTRGSNSSSGVNANVSLWRNTAVITSIKILQSGPNVTNITAGSTFTLYGIAAA